MSPLLAAASVSASAPDGHLLDDPEEWPGFGTPVADTPGLWRSSVVLQGLHCAACALRIEELLARVPGVHAVQVSAASRRGTVLWSQAHTRPSVWMGALAGSGYSCQPALDHAGREQRRRAARLVLWRWLVAGLCMMQIMMYAAPAYVAQPGEIPPDVLALLRWAAWLLSLPLLLFSCQPFFMGAWRDLVQRRISMDLPVALGMGITFAISSLGTFEPQGVFGHEVYFDALSMFVFFLLSGRWLESRLHERTAGALEALMNRLPDSVLRRQADGSFERVSARRLKPGDVLQVRPGEAMVADGLLLEGTTQVDEALLTGESRPLHKQAGDRVLAGSHNLGGAVRVQVQAVGGETRYAQVVALMAQAATDKPALVQLADRVARPFLLLVLLAAGLAGLTWWPQGPGPALMVAVAVLVVTCPCALSLAAPVALLAAAGALARGGVLVRRLQVLEALAQVDTVIFDKTGTLTHDGLVLGDWHTRSGVDPEQVLTQAALLAAHSIHPIARALARAADDRGAVPAGTQTWHAADVQEQAGRGLSGRLWQPLAVPAADAGPADAACGATAVAPPPSCPLRLGSAEFCGLRDLRERDGVLTHLVDAQGWLASFHLQEQVRADAAATVQALRALGLRVELLSGDRPAPVQRVAQALGGLFARGGCTPQQKWAALRQAQQAGHKVLMVGDGLNDGPALAAADVSVAYGQAVPLARAQADLIVPEAGLMQLALAIARARRTLAVVRQNLLWALAYNLVGLPLALSGHLPAWLAGLGMALSSLLVVLNALRLARPLQPAGPPLGDTAHAGRPGPNAAESAGAARPVAATHVSHASRAGAGEVPGSASLATPSSAGGLC